DGLAARGRRSARRGGAPAGGAVALDRRRHRRRGARGHRRGRARHPPGPGRARGVRAEAPRPTGVRRAAAAPGGQAGRLHRLTRHTDPVIPDESRPVRDEDAFEVAAVASWLREHAESFREDLDGTPEVRQFPGGASNLTYLLRYPTRDLILRRPPAG